MAANSAPRFTGKGGFAGSITLTTANTTKDGSGLLAGNLVYTAPTDGALVSQVIASTLGTNVATVLRIFVTTGAPTATTAIKVGEVTLPVTTLTETAAGQVIMFNMPAGFQDLAAGHRIYATLGTTVAAGWQIAAGASNWSAA